MTLLETGLTMKANMPKVASAVLIALTPLAASSDNLALGRLERTVRVLDNTGDSRGAAQVAARIAGSFESLAGSEANALSIVNALHEGYAVRLRESDGSFVMFAARSPMGWGGVKLTLALAQAQLQPASASSHVTPEHLIAVLNEIVAMRNNGMTWAQLAEARGAKIDVMVSSLKRTQATVSALPTVAENSKP
jgi:hypothetical protein